MKLQLWLAVTLAMVCVVSNIEAEPTPANTLNFDKDAIGAMPQDIEPVVGDWHVDDKQGVRGLMVDGSKWRQGTPSASLADQAKRLYGERYAEFLDGVKAFAFFPVAVYRGDCGGQNVAISVRFYPIAGRIDQAAGIAWSVAPDGSYFGARANALEDNLLFFRVVRGKRTILQNVRGVSTATQAWHTLKVTLQGKALSVDLDGKQRLNRKLDAPASGHCGLWSKADSQVLFDDFTITKLGAAP